MKDISFFRILKRKRVNFNLKAEYNMVSEKRKVVAEKALIYNVFSSIL